MATETDRIIAAAVSFASHQVSGTPGNWLLKGPGLALGAFWAQVVVLRGGYLYVGGDIQACVFGVYSDSQDPYDIVRWLGKHDFDRYVIEKAIIGFGSPALVWDRDDAQFAREIKELMAEFKQESREYTLLGDALSEVGERSREAIVEDLYNGGIDAESLPTGEIPSVRVIYAHAALRRLCQIWSETAP